MFKKTFAGALGVVIGIAAVAALSNRDSVALAQPDHRNDQQNGQMNDQPNDQRNGRQAERRPDMHRRPGMQRVTHAVCVLFKTGDAEKFDRVGTIHFEASANGKVRVHGEITGLTPGKHGFHVHEFGDMTSMKDGKSAGDHFNPHGMKHGEQSSEQRHVGDLGNIEANEDGVATIDIEDSMLMLEGPNSVLGRCLVAHEGEDKFTQPVGDAGGRFAFGVIGVAQK